MSASAIPTAFSALVLNSSGYTAFSTAVPTNSSTVVIAPTSTFSSQVTVASAASSSSMPASNMDSPVHCLLQPFDQGCYNLTGTPLNSAQNVTGLEGQLITSSVVGVVFFLLFCILRTRWSILYQPRRNMKRHAPPELPDTLFGWIIPLLRISQEDILEKVGLDAVVMLQFLMMSFKLFTFCSFFGVAVLVPITITSANIAGNPSALSIVSIENNSNYLIAYLIFTYVFCIAAFWLMYVNYGAYVRLRRLYLLKNKSALHSSSVMVTGIPKHLQNDRKLAEYFENLGLGLVDSAHVVRRVKNLHSSVKKRAAYLRQLEYCYSKYWGNPCQDPNYDPDSILYEAEMMEQHQQSTQPKNNVPFIVKQKQRPTTRTGFLGLWGEKVDAIDYYTEKYTKEDDKVMQLRGQKDFQLSSVGFVTFESIIGAQLAAQVLVDSEPFNMRTRLAKEPRDIYWKSILIPGRMKIAREILTWSILLFLVVFWVGPIAIFSVLTSSQTLAKYAPALVNNHNPVLQSIIQSILPPLAVNIFMALLPLILDALGELQGISSRSALAEATLSKYFFFLLFNVLLVFTIVSSLTKTIQDIIQNPSSVANLLATSLPQVAPFFINYVILKGFMLMPLELLLIGSLIVRGFNYVFLCKTPRDYAEARAPPSFSYGWAYPNSLLVFVIVLEYSTVAPLILLFGAAYFGFCYVVYKYQFLYVYFQPYETAGGAWPMVFPRIIAGMLIFQLTMTGLFFLKQYIVLGALCVPLIAITIVYKIVMDKAYYRSTKALPLQLLKEDMMKLPTHVEFQALPNERKRSARPPSIASATSINSRRPSSIKSESPIQDKDLTDQHQGAHPDAIQGTETDHHDSSVLPGVGGILGTEKNPVRKPLQIRSRVTLDFDDYEAVPDKLTDYRQPPQTLINGILDTGLRRYGNPVLIGVLPQLWLPVKASGDENDARPRPKYRSRRSTGHVPVTLSNMVKRAESARKAVSGRARTIHRPRRKTAVYNTSVASGGNSAISGQQPPVPSAVPSTNANIDMPAVQQITIPAKTNANPRIIIQVYKDGDNENIDAASYNSRPEEAIEEEGEDIENDNESDSEPDAPEVHKTYYHHPERRVSSSSIPSNHQL